MSPGSSADPQHQAWPLELDCNSQSGKQMHVKVPGPLQSPGLQAQMQLCRSKFQDFGLKKQMAQMVWQQPLGPIHWPQMQL
ncbi:unnamed protein product [Pleuronectes platessa]|uniref:Uncharacterized protein n=1 Tax=Pleuronectes platessa TaxID=8262 RepID=A0A9N7YB23_PLEPL|nr:unnamed protein product [Pleuronectes platessa]